MWRRATVTQRGLARYEKLISSFTWMIRQAPKHS